MDVYEDRRIETAIVLGAAVAMAWRLRIMSWHSEACLLLCASTLAVAADRSWLPRSTAARSHLRCSYRAGASAGIGLGCATPMLVVGALTISRLQHAAATGPLRALLWASALGSTQVIFAVSWSGSPYLQRVRSQLLWSWLGGVGCFVLLGISHATIVVGVSLLSGKLVEMLE